MLLDYFKARMGELIDQIKGSKLEPGSEGIFMPGEIEYGRKIERRKSGVPLTNPTIAALNAEAEGAGLPTLGAIDSLV